MVTTEQLLEVLTTEDVIEIMTELGSDPPSRSSNMLMFTAICHGSHKKKLGYYIDSKFFQCFSECGVMSIFDLLMSIKGWTFKQAFNHIAKSKGLNTTQKHKGLRSISENSDLEFLELHLYKPKKKEIILPTYNDCVMNVFDDYVPESWVEEGISIDAMQEYGVKFYFNQYKAIIPHRDIHGRLIGIKSRNFFQSEVEAGRKYVPISIEGLTYRYPSHFNLYGLHINKENIKKFKKVILFESEKSVWLYHTYYGKENNIAVATCGMTLSTCQRDLILSLEVEEVILAWDKQYQVEQIDKIGSKEYREFIKYIKALKKVYKLLARYCDVSIVLDWESDGKRISYKDSPIDGGKEIFEELLGERYSIEDESQFDELIEVEE